MFPVSPEPEFQYFTTDDGLRLAYDDTGSGVPLLCLPGLTRNMSDFNFVWPHLRDRCRMIRLDFRGRGQSEFDKTYTNYSVLRETQDVVGLLDHLGLDRAAILGTSRGGLVGMVLAMGFKDRLLGVCLNDIGPIIEPEGLAHIATYLGNRPDYHTWEDAADGMVAAHGQRFPGVSRDRWRAQAEHLWHEDDEGLHLRYDENLRRAFLEQPADGNLPDLWMMFDALADLPIGLIRGQNSDILSADTAREMLRRRSDMLFAEIPDRGHVPFLDEPTSLDLLDTFVSTLQTSASEACERPA